MREAVIAQSRGECDTPMPMHLDLSSGGGGEVHIKSSYRQGGRHFALKVAGRFARRPYGSILLVSVETGETVAYFDDGGYLTDLRTAAVSAMVARELGRTDTVLGILGTGVQARLQAQLHAAVLKLEHVLVWGRNPDHLAACVREIAVSLPGVRVVAAASPAEVAGGASSSSRRPPPARRCSTPPTIRPGTHISAVGADSPGKQELDPAILKKASLLLVDSLAQCERSASCSTPRRKSRAPIEIGAFCASPVAFDRAGITVADFTGLGAEDLFIAEACLARLAGKP